MPKKSTAPKTTKTRAPRKAKKAQKRDFSQIALSVVEKATGGPIK